MYSAKSWDHYLNSKVEQRDETRRNEVIETRIELTLGSPVPLAQEVQTSAGDLGSNPLWSNTFNQNSLNWKKCKAAIPSARLVLNSSTSKSGDF